MQKSSSGGGRSVARGGGGSGSRASLNHHASTTRGPVVDPHTYGMLLWQSKLQDKLLQEAKEKKQKAAEEQQMKLKENETRVQTVEKTDSESATRTQHFVEVPQMIPGPAPSYAVVSSSSLNALSQQVEEKQHLQQQSHPKFDNVATTPIETQRHQQQESMFPNIPNRIRTSTSCDNFKKPMQMLGNIVSFGATGGAGSPRRTPSGKLVTALRGDPEIRYHQKDTRNFDQTIRYLMDRDKVLEYKRELDRQVEEKKMWRSQLGSAAMKSISRRDFTAENGGNNTVSVVTDPGHFGIMGDRTTSGGVGGNNKNGIELAPLMRKFNSLPKLNTLSSTDVTRPYVHSPRNEFFHPIQPNEVAETLSSQLREKEWLVRRQQESERIATERHFQTWESFWGRPGAGAPIPSATKVLGSAVSIKNLYAPAPRVGFNKVNLFQALHMTHQQKQHSSSSKSNKQ